MKETKPGATHAKQEIRVRSGRDDKVVAAGHSLRPRNKRRWRHNFVVSTGAKRSGEICGLLCPAEAAYPEQLLQRRQKRLRENICSGWPIQARFWLEWA